MTPQIGMALTGFFAFVTAVGTILSVFGGNPALALINAALFATNSALCALWCSRWINLDK